MTSLRQSICLQKLNKSQIVSGYELYLCLSSGYRISRRPEVVFSPLVRPLTHRPPSGCHHWRVTSASSITSASGWNHVFPLSVTWLTDHVTSSHWSTDPCEFNPVDTGIGPILSHSTLILPYNLTRRHRSRITWPNQLSACVTCLHATGSCEMLYFLPLSVPKKDYTIRCFQDIFIPGLSLQRAIDTRSVTKIY